MFDFSNYPKGSKFFDDTNKKVLDEFVGLKPKLYSIKKIHGKECNAAKGVNIATEFNEFKDAWCNKKLLDTKWEEFRGRSIN